MARFKQGDIIHHNAKKLILDIYVGDIAEHPRYKYLVLDNGIVDSAPVYWVDIDGERVA
jgi:hypothetical protein